MNTVRMLRRPELVSLCGRSKTALYYDEVNGLTVKGVKLGPRAVGYPANEVQAVINARLAGKTDSEIRSLVDSLHAARKLLA